MREKRRRVKGKYNTLTNFPFHFLINRITLENAVIIKGIYNKGKSRRINFTFPFMEICLSFICFLYRS